MSTESTPYGEQAFLEVRGSVLGWVRGGGWTGVRRALGKSAQSRPLSASNVPPTFMRRGTVVTWGVLVSLAVSGTASVGAPLTGLPPEIQQTVDEACVPHPPILVTEDVGPQGFALAAAPPIGAGLVPRPGSGVVLGLGTAENPFVITRWCIEGSSWQGLGVTPARAHGIEIRDTQAHVVIQKVWVRDHTGMGIRIENASHVTIVDTIIEGSDERAVLLDRAQDVTLRRTTIEYNQNGVLIENGADVTIQDSRIGREGVNLRVVDSMRVMVENSMIHEGMHGIQIVRSPDAIVRGSLVEWSQAGLYFGVGIRVEDSPGVVIENNSLHHNNGYGIQVMADSDGVIIRHNIMTRNGAGVSTNANDLRIEANNISGSRQSGIDIRGHRIHFAGNHVSDNRLGITLGYSVDSRITDNLIEDNRDGVSIAWNTRPELSGNVIRNHEIFGLTVSGNTGGRVTDNEITGARFGFGIDHGNSDMLVAHNLIADNWQDGLRLGHSYGIDVSNNSIRGNGNGVNVHHSGDKTLGHNNIESNAVGLIRIDGGRVDARQNWWGCGEGPAAPGCDAVVGQITLDPWRLAPVAGAGPRS